MERPPEPPSSSAPTMLIDMFIRMALAALGEALVRMPRETKLKLAAKLHELLWPELN